MFVDIDDLLDVENDLLDTDDDLLQELDLGTAQAATPAARPVSRTGVNPIAALRQLSAKAVSPDQGTKRPYRERPPLRARCKLCKLCKLVVRRPREMRRFKRCRLPCKDKMVAHKLKIMLRKARSVAGQLAQGIRFQERRSDENGLSGALRL